MCGADRSAEAGATDSADAPSGYKTPARPRTTRGSPTLSAATPLIGTAASAQLCHTLSRSLCPRRNILPSQSRLAGQGLVGHPSAFFLNFIRTGRNGRHVRAEAAVAESDTSCQSPRPPLLPSL